MRGYSLFGDVQEGDDVEVPFPYVWHTDAIAADTTRRPPAAWAHPSRRDSAEDARTPLAYAGLVVDHTTGSTVRARYWSFRHWFRERVVIDLFGRELVPEVLVMVLFALIAFLLTSEWKWEW